ncbi:MAG: hypothetical protein K9M99_04280 [Candidatus Cloacimonetes bacterium]|nr:hypothetical protein [Candidatus Cloacimonadota bacterium]
MRTGIIKTWLLLFLIVVPAALLIAVKQEGENNNTSIALILEEIRGTQNVTSDNKIQPDKVNILQLGKLGEAVFSNLFPDRSKREFMENLMREEDSESLEELYQRIGYKYLKEGFKLPVNDLSSKPKEPGYHIGFGEILVLLSFLILVILWRIFSYVKEILRHNKVGKGDN